MTRSQIAYWLRVAGRVWSIVSLAFVLAFFIGEALSGASAPPASLEWLGLAFFPVGLSIGLVVGWWRAGLGGAITLLSSGLFYLWNWVARGTWPRGPYFALLAAPGLLYLLSVWLDRDEPGNLAASH